MQKEYLGKTKNNLPVFVDVDTSHAITHFANQPKLRQVVEKVIPTLEAKEDLIRVELDTGEVIGTTDLVETTDQDKIVYAMRPRRQVYSRFVKNKTSAPSSWVTMILYKTPNDEYSLHTAFVGRNTPSFPGGDYLPEQSREFWSKHALVWSSQDIIPDTETSVCPW